MKLIRSLLLVLCAAGAAQAQQEIKVGGIFDLTGITSDVALQQAITAVYPNINTIDPLVGALAAALHHPLPLGPRVLTCRP